MTLAMKKKKVNIPVKNEGLLSVPEGKSVDSPPMSHFENLINKKGWAAVSRALTNLHTWNRNNNKELAAWADNMQDRLAAWVESKRKK
jgi:hypothetical protein